MVALIGHAVADERLMLCYIWRRCFSFKIPYKYCFQVQLSILCSCYIRQEYLVIFDNMDVIELA